MKEISIKEFIVDESIFTDISFDEEADRKSEDLLENKRYEESEIDVMGCNVEDIHKVQVVEQQDELMATHHNIFELGPHILEE